MTKTDKISRRKLLNDVRKASFAALETALYLDTHPCDTKALEALNAYCAQKDAAVAAYEAQYGPLTVCSCKNTGPQPEYEWATLPWPWELEDC